MRKISRLAPLALASSLAASGLFNICSFGADSSSYIYHLFDYGPGVVNLSAGDNLSDYQWALKNEGRFRRVQSQLNLESLGGSTFTWMKQDL